MPPRGSIAEGVLVELLARERWEKVTTWELERIIEAMFNRIPYEKAREIVEHFRKELVDRIFHATYDPRRFVQRIFQRVDRLKESRDHLKKLDAMTV